MRNDEYYTDVLSDEKSLDPSSSVSEVASPSETIMPTLSLCCSPWRLAFLQCIRYLQITPLHGRAATLGKQSAYAGM